MLDAAAVRLAHMALVRKLETGQEVNLRGRTLFGRSSRSDVQLAGSGASAEHASIAWNGDDWTIRDLKSRNGVMINSSRLNGRNWRLEVGDTITFGDPTERWLWVEGGPPCAMAIRDDGTLIEADGQLLFLPSREQPEVMIHAVEGSWYIEHDAQLTVAHDGDEIPIGAHRYRLELPEREGLVTQTRTLLGSRDFTTAHAIFHVSRDEEHVDLTVVHGETSYELPARTYYYALLLLARARLADLKAGIPDCDAGWVYGQEMAGQLRTSVQNLNVDIHRARQLVARLAAFDNPSELVQRRKTTTQLRFGVSSIVIHTGSRTPA
jgi:FHA domain